MSFEDLPNELLVQILKCVPNASPLNIVSKQFNNIICDIERRVFKNPDKYIEELSAPVYFLLKDKKYHKSIWDQAILKGNLDLIIKLGDLGYRYIPNWEMTQAAQLGYKKLVDFFIVKGADAWDWGMQAAAEEGHKDLVNFFVEKGAKWWDRAMSYASKGGYKDLIDFFIEKGANAWDEAMGYAAQGGHKHIVDFFIVKGANKWKWGVQEAKFGRHKDLVNFFKEKIANDRD